MGLQKHDYRKQNFLPKIDIQVFHSVIQKRFLLSKKRGLLFYIGRHLLSKHFSRNRSETFNFLLFVAI